MKVTLKAARVNAGYTLVDAAKQLSVIPQTLTSWEHGSSIPSDEYMTKICSLYKCSPSDIFLGKTLDKTKQEALK